MGLGIETGLGLIPTMDTGAGVTLPVADLMMTPLTDLRVYQRAAATGGAFGLGEAGVGVTITSAGAARIDYRLRDAETLAVVQDWAEAALAVAPGVQTITCTVPARLGWYHLDLRANGDDSQIAPGSSRIGVGRLIGLGGQSQMVRMMRRIEGADTMASLGVPVSPYGATYLNWTDSAVTSPGFAWRLPADGATVQSPGAAELLRLAIAASGVTCALVGYAVGATAISAWAEGTAYRTALIGALAAQGSVEDFIWYLGGTDMTGATSAAQFKAGTASLLDAVAVAAGPGRIVLTATGTRSNTGVSAVNTIRRAMQELALERGAAYVDPRDFGTVDGVHQTPAGSVAMARHYAAALAGDYDPPRVMDGTRSGTVITLPVVLTRATELVLSESFIPRIRVYPSGVLTGALTVASVAVSGTDLSVTLAADPGDMALDVWIYAHPDPLDGATGHVRDNNASHGMVAGRHLCPSTVPVTVPAPGGPGQLAATFGGGAITVTSSGTVALPVVAFGAGQITLNT